MAVARAVASSSAFLACAFAPASTASDFFLASEVVCSASVAGGGQRLLRLGPRRRDRPLGLLLGRGQHPLGLLAGLGAGLVRVLLGVVALPGDVFVGLGLLGPGLVVGQLEDLGDALADFLVRGLGPERLLARRGQVALEFLFVVKGTGKSLL